MWSLHTSPHTNKFILATIIHSAVLDRFQLRERLQLLLDDIDVNNLDDLANRGRQAGTSNDHEC